MNPKRLQRTLTGLLLAGCICGGFGLLLANASGEDPIREEKTIETEEASEEALFPEDETETEEETEVPELSYDYHELTVDSPTPFEGNFFTSFWGNAVSDLDVRSLIHGYNLVQWRSEDGIFAIDPSVVSGTVVTQNVQGDHTYTLALCDDLYYNDGTPITAKDYAFSMLLSIAPEMEQIGADLQRAQYLVGYEDYVTGKAQALSGLRIVDDYTLQITIDHSWLPFFYEVALLDCNPYPIDVLAPGCMVVDLGEGAQIVNEDDKIKEPLFTAQLLQETILDEENGYQSHPAITCGPYQLVSYDREEGCAEFEINPWYKGNSQGIRPEIERILYSTGDESPEMVTALSEGSCMLVNKCVDASAVGDGIRLISSAPRQFAMSNYARSGLSYISFCCERSVVGRKAVRQAIAYCLDKDQMVKDYVGNYGLRADGYYGLGQWMYQLVSGTLKPPVKEPDNDEDAQALKEYEEELAAWKELSLDEVKIYDLDLTRAAEILVKDGWTLNEKGEDFDPREDAIRFKWLDDQLVGLDLTLLYPEGNRIGVSLEKNLVENLKQIGIRLTLEEMPMTELLRQYYRQDGERSCDMIYLATNFDLVFDPSLSFQPESEEEESIEEEETEEEAVEAETGEGETTEAVEPETGEGETVEAAQPETGEGETAEAVRPETEEGETAEAVQPEAQEAVEMAQTEAETEEPGEEEEDVRNIFNTTGISDQKLYELALDMIRTENGDILTYCQKWVAFQERFAQVEPMIPVYSNVYFDFYTRVLQNYKISDYVDWGQAIVASRLGDAQDLEEETEEMEELTEEETEELREGEIFIDD